MPAPFNTTGIEEATTIVDIVVYANTVTNQIFVSGMVVAIWVVLVFVLMIKSKFTHSIFASSFAMFILSLLLRQAKLINFILPMAFLVLTAFTALYLYMAKK